MNRIEEIRAREAAATPGPWVTDEQCRIVISQTAKDEERVSGCGYSDNGFICDLSDGEYHVYKNFREQDANAEFIAHAREDIDFLLGEVERLNVWINDLQSGMYVNCVYCGHRYGPESDTPVSMAEVLKEHVEQCPKHPMSALKKELESEKRRADELDELIEYQKAKYDSEATADRDRWKARAEALKRTLIEHAQCSDCAFDNTCEHCNSNGCNGGMFKFDEARYSKGGERR